MRSFIAEEYVYSDVVKVTRSALEPLVAESLNNLMLFTLVPWMTVEILPSTSIMNEN